MPRGIKADFMWVLTIYRLNNGKPTNLECQLFRDPAPAERYYNSFVRRRVKLHSDTEFVGKLYHQIQPSAVKTLI